MTHDLALLGAGLLQGLSMFWATLWALVLGFGISGAVQSFVSRREMHRWLGGRGPGAILRAGGFGAASSSCSYAASALARALFADGASFEASMVFMIASTNLVIELGLVMLVLLGWQFVAAELVGGILMIAAFPILARLTIPAATIAEAGRRIAAEQEARGVPGPEVSDRAMSWRQRLGSAELWRAAARYCLSDLRMLRKEIAAGFIVAGLLAALIPDRAWSALFVAGHGFASTLENVAIGPLIAILSFVCSVGNVPLAAALWRGGISFGAVLSFVFADLLTLPLLLIYRRHYGLRLTLRLAATFWVLMSLAGLATQALFSALDWVPGHGKHLVAAGQLGWSSTSGLDVLALALLLGAFLLSRSGGGAGGDRRFVTDPVCGMQVERLVAPERLLVGGETVYFCSGRCRRRFVAASGGALPSPAVEDFVMPQDTDPVCGMPLPTAPAGVELEEGGRTLRFCSEGCRERWLEHPERYRATPAQETSGLDPVCGMEVDSASAPQASHQGRNFYFCSESCRQRFLEAPDVFGAMRSLAPDGPGTNWPIDPVCQMRVDPADPGATLELAEGTVYFCCRPCADEYRARSGALPGGVAQGG